MYLIRRMQLKQNTQEVNVVRWPRGLGNIHWPQIWDLPKSHHADDSGWSTVRAETFTGYLTAKSTYRLNFL